MRVFPDPYHRESGRHDYLGMPEILRDICDEYNTRYEVCLHKELTQALVPAIVKFWSTRELRDSYADQALYYLYVKIHQHPMSINSNTCFDGRNAAIPAQQIVLVEQVMQTPYP